MKHILYSAIALGLALGLGSCTENYEDYNRNPSGVSKEEMEQGGYSLIAAMNNLESWIIPTDVNTNQFTDASLVGATVVISPTATRASLARTSPSILLRTDGTA